MWREGRHSCEGREEGRYSCGGREEGRHSCGGREEGRHSCGGRGEGRHSCGGRGEGRYSCGGREEGRLEEVSGTIMFIGFYFSVTVELVYLNSLTLNMPYWLHSLASCVILWVQSLYTQSLSCALHHLPEYMHALNDLCYYYRMFSRCPNKT